MEWFKHDSNANLDEKLQEVLLDYGLEGYGLYWYCVELIVGKVSSDNITFELKHDARIIARNTGSSAQKVEEMMKRFVDVGLFENQDGAITCLKVAKRLMTSATSNPQMRNLIQNIKQNHIDNDASCRRHDEVMPDKIRIDRLDKIEKKDSSAVALSQADEDFEVFWNMYPKKKDKIKAKAAWKKEKPPIDLVLKALEWQINSKDWVKENGKFIKYPERYITHGSWMDVESVSQSVDFTQWLGVGKPELKIVKDVEND